MSWLYPFLLPKIFIFVGMKRVAATCALNTDMAIEVIKRVLDPDIGKNVTFETLFKSHA